MQATADLLREEILAHLARHGPEEAWLIGYEDEVLARLGVSRPTLQQAVRLLEAEQLIFVRRGVRGGLWGRAPSVDGVRHAVTVLLRSRGANMIDLMEAFAVSATSSMGMAAAHGDDEARRRLVGRADDIAAIARATVRQDRSTDVIAAERIAFYRSVAALVDNVALRLQFELALDLVVAARRPTYLEPEHLARSVRYYRSVAGAIARGDGPGAERRAKAFYAGLLAWMREQTHLHETEWSAIE